MELLVAIGAAAGLGVLAHFFGYDSREGALDERIERAMTALRDGDAEGYVAQLSWLEHEVSRSRGWTIR